MSVLPPATAHPAISSCPLGLGLVLLGSSWSGVAAPLVPVQTSTPVLGAPTGNLLADSPLQHNQLPQSTVHQTHVAPLTPVQGQLAQGSPSQDNLAQGEVQQALFAQQSVLPAGAEGLPVTPPALSLEQMPDLPAMEMASLMQQAEQARQTALSQAARITQPTLSAKVPGEVLEATQNQMIRSSISNGITENLPPSSQEVANPPVSGSTSLDNPVLATSTADKELDAARQQTQVSAAHADIVQNKPVNTGVSASSTAIPTAEKPGWFKRLWLRVNPFARDDATDLPLINVTVLGAPDALRANVEGKLSQYTAEAFSDFRASLPQLRSMARDAAEAVGYYNAEFRFEQIDANSLRVRVTPNAPVRVASQRIRYEGEANQDNTFLEIQKNPDLAIHDRLNDQLYERTKSRISSAATEKGYFDGYWIMHDVQVNLPANTADINLAYASGQRYQLGNVVFKNSNPDAPIPLRAEILQQLVPFKPQDDYGAWKISNLSRNLSDTRYFNSVQVDVVIPDPIVKPLQLPPGAMGQLTPLQQQALGLNQQALAQSQKKPVAAGATGVNESRFAGMGIQENMPVEQSAEAQAALTEAQIREAERKALAQQVRQTRVIPVSVTVNADKPNSAEAGIGYGTDTKLRFRSQYRKALVNDRGHSVDGNLELSKIRQAADVRYNLPYKHPLEDTLSIFAGYEIEDRNRLGRDLQLETNSATIGIERAIKPKTGNWQHTLSARYRNDQLKRQSSAPINQADFPPPFNLDNSRFEQQSLLFGYGANKTTTVGRLDPVRAFRQFYQVEVGSKSLLTDTDLAILRAGMRFIYSFGNDNQHQVVGRGDAATILTKDNFDDVPYNLRFFAGGDQSIRGYDYKSLSTLRNGYLIGGQNLGVASFEYNYRFKPKWRGAVFVDAGNAFDKNFTDPVKVGAGFGVRWSSPVGPIRVDIGAGVSEANIPIRLHFFIGPQL